MLTKIKQWLAAGSAKQRSGIFIGRERISVLHQDTEQASWQGQEYPMQAGQWQQSLAKVFADCTKGSTLHLVLSPERYQLVQLDKPQVANEELAQALPWQVKDLVNIAVDDMVLDYIELPAALQQVTKLSVVVSSKSWLSELVALAEQAQLHIASIQPEEWLIHPITAHTGHSCLVVCHQPGEDVMLQVMREGQLQFSRRLRGFNLLHTLSLEQLQQGLFDSLILEMQRSMDYVEAQLKLAPVRDIMLLCQQQTVQQLQQLLQQSGFSRVQALQLHANLAGAEQLELARYWQAIAAQATSREQRA
ncbi:hypothetical protein [Arsukibacterium sp.]|uniref:hypothetical protein n=1 Tax=Arsukibacterium sp. TaxID=1977258 RepID=UPI002FDA67B7